MSTPDFQLRPKIELHLHLDISLSADVCVRLDPDLTPARYPQEIVAPAKCRNLAEYLARTRASVALLQSETALRLAVQDVLRQLAADHVIYAELRFAPLLHTQQGLTPEAVVAAVLDESERAVAATGVEVRWILCTLRHFSQAQSLETARLVKQFRATRVAALDLAGGEAEFPLGPHLAAFEYAAAHGLNVIAHAGEASGPASVWETLEHLNPRRIGHGVRSIEDPALVAYLREQRMHLEVCPTSNVQIDIYPTLADHPVDELYRAGVSLSINTDARAVTPTTLSDDYARLAETFGWRDADFLACNLHALEASFAPPALRPALLRRLRAGYGIT